MLDVADFAFSVPHPKRFDVVGNVIVKHCRCNGVFVGEVVVKQRAGNAAFVGDVFYRRASVTLFLVEHTSGLDDFLLSRIAHDSPPAAVFTLLSAFSASYEGY